MSQQAVQVERDHPGARTRAEKALKMWREVLGTNHPRVVKTLSNLGTTLTTLGEYVSAKQRLEEALSVHEALRTQTQLPRIDPLDVAATYSALGRLSAFLGDDVAAMAYFERAQSFQADAGPRGACALTGTLNNIGLMLQRTGDYGSAAERFREALGNNQDCGVYARAYALNNLGATLTRMREYAAAKWHLDESLRIKVSMFGPSHVTVARTLSSLGVWRQSTGDYEGARAHFERDLL